MTTRLERAVAASLIALAACGGGGAKPDAGPPDAHDTPDSVTGTITDFIARTPIAGAMICANGIPTPACATAGADGTYALVVPLLDGVSQIAQLSTADGYLGRENLLVEDPTADNQYTGFWENIGGLYATADATTYLATEAGFMYPTTTAGFVRVSVFGTGDVIPTATATIVPAPASGGGPVYADTHGVPNPTLKSTAANGDILFGNLTPGTYAITITATGATCTIASHGGTLNGEWPPVGTETLSVDVTANALTAGLSVNCM